MRGGAWGGSGFDGDVREVATQGVALFLGRPDGFEGGGVEGDHLVVALFGSPEQLDRFETELGPFHQRVRDEYLRRVAREPQRMRRIDSSLARSEVEKIVSEVIVSYCFN